MLDGLLKSKFYNKCKTDLKMVKARIDMIKKKRNAMQKYLKNDVADLLKNGLDVNAYGRAEGLLLEQNRTECYEFIEQCAVLLLSNLEIMNKQREECPEEYREAVSSLSFAAARFADLPELRDLRTMFSERYGKLMDSYANKEFVEKLKSGIPSKDQKLQFLQDIAHESGLEWNSKALENKLYNEATCNEVLAEETDDGKYSFLPERVSESVQETYSLPKDARRVLPVKDIIVDTIRKDEKENEPLSARSDSDDKTPKYQWRAPPYTKSATPAEIQAKAPEHEDTADKKTKPVPKSVRRRKALSPKENAAGSSNSDEQEKNSEEKGSPGWRMFRSSGIDEEETMLDKLLRHYSRKKGPNENVKPEAQGREPIRSRNKSSSFLDEIASPGETPKGHTRAVSLQPEMLSEDADAHVHPKLPDYDDFLARLKAFRRNG